MKHRGYEEVERLSVDEKLKKIIGYHLVNFWKHLNVKRYSKIESAFDFFINDEKGKVALVDRIEEETFSIEGKKVLDIGCGKGGLIISCALRGGDAIGIDIDSSELRIAKLRTKKVNGINPQLIRCCADLLPFRSNLFDLVTATSVLEHVDNPDKVVKEMVRILKPRGYIFLTGPSPSFPREAYYKIFYIPYLPKKFGKIYLQLRGFNPSFFLQEVTYPYPSASYIERLLSLAGMVVENLTEREIKEKFKNPETVQSKRLKGILQFIERLRLNHIAAKVACRLDIYPGFSILARKN
jgi:ubiquinone/menaquinone biosynthesis C-methylase UbiE